MGLIYQIRLSENSFKKPISLLVPSIFAVGNTYYIMISIKYPSLVFVRIGDEEYFDESNGFMCSKSLVHRVVVPMAELDCGEDKPDDHPEHGYTVACHNSRKGCYQRK